MIHLVSAFRNSEHRLTAYFAQAYALRAATGFGCQLTLLVGDSTDQTERELTRYVADGCASWARVHRYDHEKPDHGSTETPERLIALSGLLNFGLCEASLHTQPGDVVIWVESDLYWDAYTMIQLARFLRRPEVQVVAPMIFAGEAFYDIWGFRTLDGRRWGPFFPWGDRDQIAATDPLVPMGSVGSCVAMTAEVAQNVRVQDGHALVGWCRDARRQGHRIWCAKDLRIQHPFDWRT